MRKLVALLLLSFRCLFTINVLWFFLTVPWVGLQYVIVVFPDHTHFLFNQGKRTCYESSVDQHPWHLTSKKMTAGRVEPSMNKVRWMEEGDTMNRSVYFHPSCTNGFFLLV